MGHHPGNRAGQHDRAAPPAVDQRRPGRLDRLPHAGQVDVEHHLPVVLGQLQRRAEAGDTGAGRHDVEPPEPVQGRVDDLLERRQVAHVGPHGHDPPVELLDQLHRLVQVGRRRGRADPDRVGRPARCRARRAHRRHAGSPAPAGASGPAHPAAHRTEGAGHGRRPSARPPRDVVPCRSRRCPAGQHRRCRRKLARLESMFVRLRAWGVVRSADRNASRGWAPDKPYPQRQYPQSPVVLGQHVGQGRSASGNSACTFAEQSRIRSMLCRMGVPLLPACHRCCAGQRFIVIAVTAVGLSCRAARPPRSGRRTRERAESLPTRPRSSRIIWRTGDSSYPWIRGTTGITGLGYSRSRQASTLCRWGMHRRRRRERRRGSVRRQWRPVPLVTVWQFRRPVQRASVASRHAPLISYFSPVGSLSNLTSLAAEAGVG
jgi:hypothetical protein